MKMLRILLLEDSLLDAELAQVSLAEAGIDCQLVRVETRTDFLNALQKESFDLILADYSLPSFDGISALEIAQTLSPEVPFIFVSATLGEELAIEAMKSGATDYVLKQRLRRLVPSVHRALREAKERRERQQAEHALQESRIRERQQASRLQKLAEASLIINSTLSLAEILQLITEQAREIIEAHQSVASLTADESGSQAINAVSLSDKYPQWQASDQKPDSASIYTLVCRLQGPMRMTQAELEAHPTEWEFSKSPDKHPPMRGWLAAPLTSRNGKNIGLIQLSDKYEGEFTEEDETILVQLAQMASAAIDNAWLYQESQQANRVKDEFLAVLSHELRSPLNAILGWSQMLRSRKLNEVTTSRALETIERNARLQTQLIEDLLDISRIIQGKLNLRVCPVNLTSTIEAAIDTMRLAAEAKSINLKFTIADLGLANSNQISASLETEKQSDNCPSAIEEPKVLALGDPNRLQQIVWNLISNAIKFTPAGGHVEIRLAALDSHAQIIIKDTGKGIRAEFLPHVFDYFRQADASITRNHGGLGLGLAIVRHLVELHGGTVSVESPGDNQGATFTVRLPLISTQSDKDEADESSGSSPRLDGARVLIVDDELDSREFLIFMLEQYGASVMAVASAEEALVAFEKFQPVVLVSDIGMPGEDGYSLIHKVRSRAPAQGGQVPAIALTAYARDGDRNQALAAGFQRHLAKPVEPAELAAVIASLME
jgi:signal transduction histidine kinase/DNA-binding response OmpR family regulator